MSSQSTIEWTEQTWNPVIGCTKISAGCKHCYAETMSARLKLMGVKEYEDGFEVRTLPARLQQPLLRKKPSVYFVNSMSDLFHPEVPDSFIRSVFHVMRQAHWHTFQVLTKRSERLRALFSDEDAPPNVWLGVSVENQKHGLPRIDDLRFARASVRFLSVEPLLEDLGELNLDDIHWVIVGGESGRGARQMQPHWVEAIRAQCVDQSVPFFFKQWGAWGADGVRRNKKANGRMLDGRVWDGLPKNVNAGLLGTN